MARDGTVKDRAKQTAPWPLSICDSKVKGAGLGVWTNEDLPVRLLFGPYEGYFLPNVEEGKESGYGWHIRGTGLLPGACIDALDESVSNWMRFVNCSRNERETNLAAFQFKGQIYYKTIREIRRGAELMVWYGDDYGQELGLSKLNSTWSIPQKDVIDGRQCEWCATLFSSRQYLFNHQRFCRKRYARQSQEDYSPSPTSSSSNCKVLSVRNNDVEMLKSESIQNSMKFGNNTTLGDIDRVLNAASHNKDNCNGSDKIIASNTQMNIHKVGKVFKCSECEYETTNSNIKTYMHTHTKEKPFECSECGYRCTKSGNLKTHIMRIHTKEKPFECSECEYRCTTSSDLKIHMRIHTKEKPFECSECGYRSTQHRNLKRHKLTHKRKTL